MTRDASVYLIFGGAALLAYFLLVRNAQQSLSGDQSQTNSPASQGGSSNDFWNALFPTSTAELLDPYGAAASGGGASGKGGGGGGGGGW